MTLRLTKKKAIIAFAILLLAVTSIVVVLSVARNNRGLKTYRTENGWGYSISEKGKVIINQPFIPAAGGKKPFKTRRDAAKTGRMVIKKLQQGKRPTLTLEDLKKAGIIT